MYKAFYLVNGHNTVHVLSFKWPFKCAMILEGKQSPQTLLYKSTKNFNLSHQDEYQPYFVCISSGTYSFCKLYNLLAHMYKSANQLVYNQIYIKLCTPAWLLGCL